MMHGPSLTRPDIHAEIHAAALAELEEGTAVLRRLIERQDASLAAPVATALIETWRARVIAHADVEEESLYPWLLASNPAAEGLVAQLKAQHALLRRLAAEAAAQLECGHFAEVLRRLDALLLINTCHGDDEMPLIKPA
ncbi:MAG: hemerythrin domain-containing protein [Mycobacterium leprae]